MLSCGLSEDAAPRTETFGDFPLSKRFEKPVFDCGGQGCCIIIMRTQNWAIRIMLTLMLLFWASPAFAAIERFTDDKGTLHITNNSMEKARLEEGEEDTATPSQRLPKRPAAVQPLPEAEQHPPALEPAEEEKPKPSSYLPVRHGVIHITNVNSKPVDLA